MMGEAGELRNSNGDIYWSPRWGEGEGKPGGKEGDGEVRYRPASSERDEKGDSSPEEQTSGQQWKEALYDFTQSTTLQGLNKITEEQPFLTRR